MQNIIIEIINKFGYFGIALLIALENIFPPIPSEVILTFGGFATTFTALKTWGVVLSATVGSLCGAVALYGIGRWLNPERMERWLNGRVGKALHLKRDDLQKADRWFRRKGKSTVLLCRFVPIVRSLISIPAGMSRMGNGRDEFRLVLSGRRSSPVRAVCRLLRDLFRQKAEKARGKRFAGQAVNIFGLAEKYAGRRKSCKEGLHLRGFLDGLEHFP